jgi:hypothetical protein
MGVRPDQPNKAPGAVVVVVLWEATVARVRRSILPEPAEPEWLHQYQASVLPTPEVVAEVVSMFPETPEVLAEPEVQVVVETGGIIPVRPQCPMVHKVLVD